MRDALISSEDEHQARCSLAHSFANFANSRSNHDMLMQVFECFEELSDWPPRCTDESEETKELSRFLGSIWAVYFSLNDGQEKRINVNEEVSRTFTIPLILCASTELLSFREPRVPDHCI